MRCGFSAACCRACWSRLPIEIAEHHRRQRAERDSARGFGHRGARCGAREGTEVAGCARRKPKARPILAASILDLQITVEKVDATGEGLRRRRRQEHSGAAGQPASRRSGHESRRSRAGAELHQPGDRRDQGRRGRDRHQPAQRDREQQAGGGAHGGDGVPPGGIRSRALAAAIPDGSPSRTATSCASCRPYTRRSSASRRS